MKSSAETIESRLRLKNENRWT